MNVLTVEKRLWRPERKHHRAPSLQGTDEPTVLIDAETQRIVAVQYVMDRDQLDAERADLTRWLRFGMPWDDDGVASPNSLTTSRLSGIRYPSRVFGYTAPNPLRRRWAASMAAINRDNPSLSTLLDVFTEENWRAFTSTAPEEAQAHRELVERVVRSDWRLARAPFTSGVINNTAALPYHRDTGNIKGSWSAMLAVRKNTDGGALHLPEYDLTFAIPDGSITMFDGQGTWHGVTPIDAVRRDGFRFTLVWYAKNGFAKIGSAADEVAAGQRRATR